VTGRLVWENLKHRPMLTLFSVLLMGIPVTLILALVGLTQGLLQDSQRRQQGTGADIIIRASTASGVVSFSSATIPEKVAAKIEEQPHVRLAVGVLNHSIDPPLVITGVDLAQFDRMSGGFVYKKGGPFQGPDDMLIDEAYAAQTHKTVGDTVLLLNHTWHVAGIIEPGKLARIAVQLGVLQDLDAATGKVGQIYVKVDDAANIDAVVKELDAMETGYKINTLEEYVAMWTPSKISGVKEFTVVIMVLGVVIGFLVVGLSMYMSVLQRTREIGILKSLGASKGFILTIIEAEAMLLGVGGTVLGIVMSFGACWLVRTLVPASIPMIVVQSWWPIAGLITLLGAGLGALYPGLNAARQDPIEALAYE
jgi:putative ABC transport system permease protein